MSDKYIVCLKVLKSFVAETFAGFANIKLLFESQNVKPSLLSSFFVHSRVFMTFAVVSSKYALSLQLL